MTSKTIRPLHHASVSLESLRTGFGLDLRGSSDGVRVTGVTLNSRDVRPGDLYAALPGSRAHGADFVMQAIELGAVAVFCDEAAANTMEQLGVDVPLLVSKCDPRELLGELSARIYGTDEPECLMFGITGTNGKTSVVYLLDELLRRAGYCAGLSSTAERRVNGTVMPSGLTSPEAPELHALIARMHEEGANAITVEISAHATARRRIDGVHFNVVAFNNLSHDHLDDFGDMESYFQAKLSLFVPERAERGVVVIDTPHGQRIARESRIPVATLSTEFGVEADWHLAVTWQSLDGVGFVLQGPGGAYFRGSVPMFGKFMAENAALALIMLHEAGVSIERVAGALTRGVIPVYIPGRLEEITPKELAQEPSDAKVRFFVDYGHTPGAFSATLDALGEVAPGRVIFMFGADGDRDRSKREDMGRIAAAGSDIVIICDYHPRTEDPAAIRAQLLAGARSAGRAEVCEEPDPRAAIRLAISLARPGDVILYAGPGHEEHQDIAGVQVAYSAREEVRGALREAGMLE
ncbi:MAG: UDP-N-acetylmuramoyl-L-alanyl-D-glutamate--2,6-diaminopimelate ligase [Microbacteriaceae bacterium]|nr:UDP-N-acetylmuramoyl-L-alanyl-D-glutamate--2,6-diaminopimelate ligase [Microbacteriaceae bacterium]